MALPVDTESPSRRFDANYHEDVTLTDGTRVHLRLVRPDDKQLLLAGFRAMSPESRYRRFFGGKNHLSARELAYLTEFDGERHLAIGATLVRPDGTETGLGVARFVRDQEDPTLAEPAVAVVDEYQSRGLGGLLMRRLGQAARERGVTRFRCVVLVDNAPVRAMIEDAASRVVDTSADADEMYVEFDLATRAEEEPHGLRKLLRHVASEAASVVLRRS